MSDTHDRAPIWRTAFEVGSTVAMVALAVAVLLQGRLRFASASAAPPTAAVAIPSEPIPIGSSAVRGSASAPVAIIEYADFECPSCAQFSRATEPILLREYVETGRVMLVFKHFPLESHPGAEPAARATWCAARQDKFWDMHDRLFRLRGELRESDLQGAAKESGVDLARYETCVAATESAQQVQLDRLEGDRLKVPGTPTFFVGKVTPDRRVQVTDAVAGSKSIDNLRVMLDRLLGN